MCMYIMQALSRVTKVSIQLRRMNGVSLHPYISGRWLCVAHVSNHSKWITFTSFSRFTLLHCVCSISLQSAHAGGGRLRWPLTWGGERGRGLSQNNSLRVRSDRRTRTVVKFSSNLKVNAPLPPINPKGHERGFADQKRGIQEKGRVNSSHSILFCPPNLFQFPPKSICS